ncbi:hypothetical protein F2Q70_00033732 [Brassica cretica]|uniref:Uncharacterized protein n=1 Tax=Brassica cretica TaxID=69181 RepID=A0A8S9JXX9_BRACR|nr:hypothetical protein F2Q68_00028604 [Brassica cretica]KAF2586223.1 hypothetical protein F2Q70_00033732 [Brassica cretica]
MHGCIEENPEDIVIDAVFDKDEGVVALDGGDSDSDGYLAEDSDLTNAVVSGTQGKISETELKKQSRKLARLNKKLVDETDSDAMKP